MDRTYRAAAPAIPRPSPATIRGRSEVPGVGLLRDLWRHRPFIWASAVADFRHRYAGSGIGVFWNIVVPLATLLTYTAVLVLIYAGRESEPSRRVGFAL